MGIDIYCDESRQDLLASSKALTENNRYCCIGGLMIPESAREDIKNKINFLKAKYGVYGEIKWSTVSPNKMQFYLELVDLFFSTPEMTFRTVVIDASKIHNEIFNDNDQELGYYKFYYQLLFHWIRCESTYRVFTDQKTNRDKQRLKELRRIVNISCHGNTPIESIQAIDSQESLLLQLQNVLMGAVCYRFNYPLQGHSISKNQLVRRVEERIGHRIQSTYPSEHKFNVFVINLRGPH